MIIQHLNPQEAQKIAAGEVVERPANILKELIENALDAGATKITITAVDGGKVSLSITDNGSGMHEDDARICFLRHTTSKLVTFDDLQTITTFGFRGEALASICSVARVKITTRHNNNDHGITLTIEDGAIKNEVVSSASIGTTIAISDLFYNVPARKKFLKTTSTEWNQIVQLFKAFCLSNLSVHFTLIHNEAVAYTCTPVLTLTERITQLFETHISKQLFTLPQENSMCSGVITGPHYSRYDRNGIFIFVNKRWVKNYAISQALLKGYKNVLQPGKYPLAVLNLTIPAEEVDINTHPKKEEVLFLHPRILEKTISDIVTATLEGHLSTRLQETATPNLSQTFSSHGFSTFKENGSSFDPFRPVFKDVSEQYNQPIKTEQITVYQPSKNIETLFNIETIATPLSENSLQETYIEESFTQYTILGQLHLTYILLEHPDGLLLIDQHAAHERIIYEQIAASFKNTEILSLLFPETISLQKELLEELHEYFPLLEHHGIIIEQFSSNECIVRAKPLYAQSVDIAELLKQISGWIHDYGKADKEQIVRFITEKMRAQIACKAAIKAGDLLSTEKMQALLKDLNQTTNRFSCPHGRPTSWLLPLFDIEKKFKRKL